MDRRYIQWIIITCLMACIVPGITAGLNYFMDPLWCFTHANKYNQKQDDFNERQQKTNYITFHDFRYQGIVIGSSTSTSINQYGFKGISVYNYAVNGMQQAEYLPYIRYAAKRNGGDFACIFMGLDFINAAKIPKPSVNPEKLISETNSPLYRVKTLISIDTLKFSRRNFMNYLYGRHIYYDRANVKYATRLSRDLQEFNMRYMLNYFEHGDIPSSFKNFRYNDGYRAELAEIRNGNPRSRFYVFTTPVTIQFLNLMVAHGLLDDYLRWIGDIVAVYGECYHFMFPSSLTENVEKNFHDPNHYYPFVSTLMMDAMYNNGSGADTPIMMHITTANLQHKLALLKRLMKSAAARRAGGR